tara:strand:+ start:146 stop:835 length:690 start_codon:yes stop_codon:yes gene_type:complete
MGIMGIKILFLSDNLYFQNALSEQINSEVDLNMVALLINSETWGVINEEDIDIIVYDFESKKGNLDELMNYFVEREIFVPIVALISEEIGGKEINKKFDQSIEFLLKPIRIESLIQRIKNILKKKKNTDNSPITFQNCILDPAVNLVTNAEGSIFKLTDKETKILEYLYKEQGKLISKEIMLRKVWRYKDEVSTHTLETHIYRLRKKIEANPKTPKIILTHIGGYKLVQ